MFSLRIRLTREALTSATLPAEAWSETPPRPSEALSMPAGILQLNTLCIFFILCFLLYLVTMSWQALSKPRYTHCKIITTANSLDFFKSFLWIGFGVVFLSCQSYLLQTLSWEVLVFQVYLNEFSQCRKKLGHKLWSSFKPVLPEELRLQKTEQDEVFP